MIAESTTSKIVIFFFHTSLRKILQSKFYYRVRKNRSARDAYLPVVTSNPVSQAIELDAETGRLAVHTYSTPARILGSVERVITLLS